MGIAARQSAETHFTWDTILDQHYTPLLNAMQ
jgi:hypothetical protein